MNRLRYRTLLVLCAFVLVSCATAQLIPDQQARVALDRAQTQLTVWWDAAGAYYSQRPASDTSWKTVVVPAFDVANRGLRNAAVGLQNGTITPDKVQAFVQKTLADVQLILTRQGVLK